MCCENIRKAPNAYGKYAIRDSQKDLVSSGEGSIKEIFAEYLLEHKDGEYFFKYVVRKGEADFDKLGYWIFPKGEDEKQIEEWAESMRGFLSEGTIEDFKELCRMDFEKCRKTK